MNLSIKLLQHRHSKRLSQQNVADALGVSQATYHSWEKGSRLPSIQYIKALGEILDIPIEDFTALFGTNNHSFKQGMSDPASKNEISQQSSMNLMAPETKGIEYALSEKPTLDKLLIKLDDCFQTLQDAFEKYQKVHAQLAGILNRENPEAD